MGRIAIVSAMHEELAAVLALMPDEHKQMVAGRSFALGHLNGHEVVVVLSRIGKVAAATTATVLMERFGVAQVLFTGVAGGLASDARVGDVVVATEFLQHDMDASPLFPAYEVPLYGRARFGTDPALTAALALAVQSVLQQGVLDAASLQDFGITRPQMHQGLIVSGDRFVSNRRESQQLQQSLPDALAVEMEGAAVAQVCHDYGVPFAAMRTVSDRADDDAHADFLKFVTHVASRYSAAILARFFAARA
ncbi:5'-methylthioadenosine/adenosylhomocysteine nucleosidase [Limnohabitans sp. Rim8]|uniref:5'-methylthioadenosine/adenosylhomocysteine nucleosidase n=1 Tax=Limnohabitans sp. Rim8 TaxID=1100718 RepID=UPI0026268A02|nr:5'-methylthioadenosine/adenosylhomocysteine nucleosidase [Limnohabitans sp. Rim8]